MLPKIVAASCDSCAGAASLLEGEEENLGLRQQFNISTSQHPSMKMAVFWGVPRRAVRRTLLPPVSGYASLMRPEFITN
jgi:hypothetical protein